MNYEELKKYCDKKIKEYPQYLKRYKKEIIIAKRFYDNGRNLYQELTDNKEKISHRYIIPFLLGYTDEVLDLPMEMEQVKPGNSGLDIDSDFSSETKEKVFEYFRQKYGKECVFHVGTYGTLGLLNAVKDLLRYNEVPFQEANNFTKELDTDKSWEENLQILKAEKPKTYAFYEKNKDALDLVPYFEGKLRNIGSHAGGIIILPGPIYDYYTPVERVQDDLVSAFCESSSNMMLDSIGVVKLDILGISVLDVIKKTIDAIDEKIYLIEENGIQKIVPESYIRSNK